MVNLGLKVVEVNGITREELIVALALLGEEDWDFNGNNGLEYLWYGVWEENGFKDMEDWENNGEPTLKYESNVEYLCDMVEDIKDDVECIETFLDTWMGNDSYYTDYQYDLLTDTYGITTIVLAYTYGD